MATETWTYDGVNLSNYVSGVMINDIRTWNGLDNIPGVNVQGNSIGGGTSGTNGMYQLAQTHGEFWYPQYFTAATKLLTMFVSSNDPSTGASPATVDLARKNFDKNFDALNLLFSRRRQLSSLVRTMSDGTSRLAKCIVDSTIQPKLIPITNAEITVELTIPDGFWWDATDTTLNTIAPGTSVVCAGATAPMQDLQFNITGPITNPRITDTESGGWVQYNGTLAAGKILVIHNTNMGIDDGGSGWAPVLANMQHSLHSNWLTLYPTVGNGGAQITFSGSGTTGATSLAIFGHKKYMR